MNLLLGTGKSTQAASRWLAARGERFQVAARQPDALAGAAARFVDTDLRALIGVQRLVVSPGIPPTHSLLRAARARTIPVTTDIDLALDAFQGHVIGVTGTNGKSTTADMIQHALQGLHLKSALGGNIGVSPCELLLADHDQPDFLVLELSSFQLHYLGSIELAGLVITNFAHDHIDWHGSYARYIAAKWRATHLVKPGGCLVIAATALEAAATLGMWPPAWRELVTVGSQDHRHGHQSWLTNNKANAFHGPDDRTLRFCLPRAFLRTDACLAALMTARIAPGTPEPATLETRLNAYRALPHRMEHVTRWDEANVVNDSKSTNVDNVLQALDETEGEITLVIGGKSKGESFRPLLDYRRRLGHIVCFGEAGPTIAAELSDLSHEVLPSLEAALVALRARRWPQPTTVLISPGCSSYDEFHSFEHRGEFIRASATASRPYH